MVGFNPKKEKNRDAADTFTFHYGRIQSGSYTLIAFLTLKFTFHYGRIQSEQTLVSNVVEANLHSIMVGFNPECCQAAFEALRHLHSIMVGFNPFRRRLTISEQRYLHSIMVGFNRQRCRLRGSPH